MIPTLHLVDDCEADWRVFSRLLADTVPPDGMIRWRRAGELMLALEKQKISSQSVFFVDLGLPGLEGHWLVRHLRGNQRVGNCTIVTVTGSQDPLSQKRSLMAGADRHLTKTTDLSKWRRSLMDCLQLRSNFRP